MKKVLIPLFFGLLANTQPLYACDMCSIYSSEKAQGGLAEGVSAIAAAISNLPSTVIRTGMAEQFTHFGTIKDGGREVSNDAGQYLNSSVTQIFIAYQITKPFSLQTNFPIINRTYQRPSDKGSESGIGDASLLGQWAVRQDYNSSWNLFGGIKLPTGNSSRIAEELSETDSTDEGPASAVHGHDLALGTGSYDFILGTNGKIRSGRYVLPANLQYALRTQGSYEYKYADDFTWQLAPGYYALLKHSYSGILGLSISGELKGNDTFRGNVANDTGTSAIYVGPQVSMTIGEKMSAMIGLDLPVLQNETSYQIVPDTRIRALFSAQL